MMQNALAPNVGQIPVDPRVPPVGGQPMGGPSMGAPMGGPTQGGPMAGFQNALMDWRQQRPQFSYDPSLDTSRFQQRQDWHGQMMDWRGQRPTPGSFNGQVGMVPGVPGSMGTNPGVMTPGGGTTGAPLQGSPAPTMPTYQFPTYQAG